MSRSRRLAVAIAINAVIVVVELGGGAVARSTALLADAGHNLVDVAGIVLSLVAVKLALRAPTAERSFGYHRATILTALFNTAAIVAVAAVVVFESVQAIAHPHPVRGGIVVLAAALALVGNAAAALVVRDGSRDLNLRAAATHLGADAAASAGVLVAGAVIATTGRFDLLDSVVALAIAGLIVVEAWRLARECVDVLLESTPSDLDLVALAATMSGVAGVEAVHDLHCWSLSSEVRAMSAHLVLRGHPTLEQAQVVCEAVKRSVGATFGINHATFELECEPCVEDASDACSMEGSARS
jgi:cobalt-zinc-cadmium efflux system protein